MNDEAQQDFVEKYFFELVLGGTLLMLVIVFGVGFVCGWYAAGGGDVHSAGGGRITDAIDAGTAAQQELTAGIAGSQERAGAVGDSITAGERRISTAAARAGYAETSVRSADAALERCQLIIAGAISRGTQDKTPH